MTERLSRGNLRPVRSAGTGENGLSLVKRAFGLFARGDLDAVFEFVHPDAEFHPVFYPGTYRGRDAIRSVFEDGGTRLGWDVSDLAFEEVGDRVLIDGRLHSRNTFGQAEEFPVAWLFDLGDGLIVGMRAFVHRRQALAAIPERSGQV
jgi:ketosteroid isomerase-like protein